MLNNTLSQYYVKSMYDIYKEAGMTDKEIEVIARTLEPLIVEDTLNSLLKNLDDAKHEEVLKKIEEKHDLMETAQALGLTKAELEEELLHKMEKYLHNLKQNQHVLKEQVTRIRNKN